MWSSRPSTWVLASHWLSSLSACEVTLSWTCSSVSLSLGPASAAARSASTSASVMQSTAVEAPTPRGSKPMTS